MRRKLAFCEFENLQSVFLQDEDNFKYVYYLAISAITNSSKSNQLNMLAKY